jgi:hypothetical protein
MDYVEQGHGLLGLVRLKPADQMEPDGRVGGLECGPFRQGFLDPILAEIALPGLDQGEDRLGRMGLRHRDQGDLFGRPAGQRGRFHNPRADPLKPFRR